MRQLLAGRITESVVALACAYECAAILSRNKIPTLSRFQSQHRLVGVVLVGWLAVHFIRYKPVIRVIVSSQPEECL